MRSDTNADDMTKPRNTYTPLARSLMEAFDLLQARYDGQKPSSGLPSGFPKLDDITGGFKAGQLIVLGGRPSMGKSSLAMNIALHSSNVGWFTLNGTTTPLAMRMIAAAAPVNTIRLHTGRLEDDDWLRIGSAIRSLKDLTILTNDSRLPLVDELCEYARDMHSERGHLGLIVVDDFQHILVPDAGKDRVVQVRNAAKSLKNLAVELRVPVLVLSQLHQELEHRRDKRPRLADLGDGGVFENIADLVLLLYREENYRSNSYLQSDKHLVEIIVAKREDPFLRSDKRLAEMIGAVREDDPPKWISLWFHCKQLRFESL